MTQKSFRENLEFGEDGEAEMASLLMKRGNKIIPLYQFNNETTPLLLSDDHDYTLPDLTCFNGGKCFFVEVKTKTRWSNWEGQRETGCDSRLYHNYKKVAEDTDIPVYMFFNHKEQEPLGIYYCNILEELPYRPWDGLNSKTKKRVSKPLYFWKEEQLKKLC